jgi:hypothetical protein
MVSTWRGVASEAPRISLESFARKRTDGLSQNSVRLIRAVL